MGNSKNVDWQIEEAAGGDWAWMQDGLIESTWEALSPELKKAASKEEVRERLDQKVAKIRGSEGFPNQAFIAKRNNSGRAGFVWVAETPHQFTGQPQGFILDIYVAEGYRNRGLGGRLMKAAEEWAKGRNLKRIELSTSVDNKPARRLYEKMDYQVEMLRMGKVL